VLDIACLQRSQDSLEKERKILTCISPPVEGKSGEFPLANPRDDLGKIQPGVVDGDQSLHITTLIKG
jgi:hypothetical protein